MSLPVAFCWTRYGTEAGQSPEEIFHRKDDERVRNGGMFLWGIGNNVAPSVSALLKATRNPKVLFSPIKSPPRPCDSSPDQIAVWSNAVGYDGSDFLSPPGSLVTSHFHGQKKNKHYALVCHSAEPLAATSSPAELHFDELVNLKSGNPLGASQVTAVVRRTARSGPTSRLYPVTLTVELVYPYVVQFNCHTSIDAAERHPDEVLSDAWLIKQAEAKFPIGQTSRQLRMFG